MDDDGFDSIFRTESVFKNQKSLNQAWVPARGEKLLRRDEIIKKLAVIHRPIAERKDPKDTFAVNTLILGNGGIGKTLTAKYFLSRFKDSVKKREYELFTEYYDCLQHRSKSSILRDVATKLKSLTGGHGYADHEIMLQILRQLSTQNKHAIIILDEVHNLLPDEIMALLNSSIGFGEHNTPISFILITRQTDWFRVQSEKLLSRIQEVIRMEPYNKEEALDILKYRRNLAFREGILEDSEVELIADIVAENKNMRNGIEIMWNCGLHCDSHRFSHITTDMILTARNEVNPTFRAEVLDQLKLHELITLGAVALTLKSSKSPYTGVDESYVNYQALCEEYNKSPHVKMSYRKYLRNLTTAKAIDSEYLNPTADKKGRQLRIKLTDITPERILEQIRVIIPNKPDYAAEDSSSNAENEDK
jgi:cell division control protein 6